LIERDASSSRRELAAPLPRAELAGIAVHLRARIAATAGAGEVVVSRTVRDLVAGSGLDLVDRGVHQLKGVAKPWRLFGVAQ
jgi:class 3 adenylate cyclase